MWIQTQDKQNMINIEKVWRIFIDRKTSCIRAEFSPSSDTLPINLGTYSSDLIDKVFEAMLEAMSEYNYITMPFKNPDEVERWLKWVT